MTMIASKTASQKPASAQRRALARRQLALVSAAAAIASTSIAAKAVYQHGGATAQLVAARLTVPAVLLLLGRSLAGSPTGVEGRRVVVAGLVAGAGLACGTWLEFGALAREPAAVVIVIVTSAPVWTGLIGWLIWRTPMTVWQLLAAAGVIIGVALMADPAQLQFGGIGCAMALADAVIAGGFYLVCGRMASEVSTAVFVRIAVITGGLLAAPTCVPGLIHGFGHSDLLTLLLLSSAAAVLWCLLVGFGMALNDSVTAATILSAEPVFVAILAFLILGEGLSVLEICGGVTTLVAVAVGAAHAGSPEITAKSVDNGCPDH